MSIFMVKKTILMHVPSELAPGNELPKVARHLGQGRVIDNMSLLGASSELADAKHKPSSLSMTHKLPCKTQRN